MMELFSPPSSPSTSSSPPSNSPEYNMEMNNYIQRTPTRKITYFYNFFPTKEQEALASITNRPYIPTRTLVELNLSNELQLQPQPEPPRTITKILENHEAITGKIHLTHDEVFGCVFHYWTLEMAELVAEKGKRVLVQVCDVTDVGTTVMYGPPDEQTFFEKLGVEDEYVLGINMDLVRSRELKKGHKIDICYENQVFFFKVLE